MYYKPLLIVLQAFQADEKSKNLIPILICLSLAWFQICFSHYQIRKKLFYITMKKWLEPYNLQCNRFNLIFALTKHYLYATVTFVRLARAPSISASKRNILHEVQRENLIITMAVLWACSINNGVWLPLVCTKEMTIDCETGFQSFSSKLSIKPTCEWFYKKIILN